MKKITVIHTTEMVYAALVMLTLLTWTMGRLGLEGLEFSLLILVLALLKGQMLGDWFMGLGRIRGPWRWAILLWLLIPGTLIGIAFTLTERA